MGKPGPARIGVDFMSAVCGLRRVMSGCLVTGYDFQLTTDELGEIGDNLQELWEDDCHLTRLGADTPGKLIPLLGGKLERRVTVSEEVAAKSLGGMGTLKWYFDEGGAGVDTGTYDYRNPDKLEGEAQLTTAKDQQFTLRGYGPFFEAQLAKMELPLDTGKTADTL